MLPLPVSAARAERALRALRGSGALTGARGGRSLDLEAAAGLASRVGELLIEQRLGLLELNPVALTDRGAIALDAVARRDGTSR